MKTISCLSLPLLLVSLFVLPAQAQTSSTQMPSYKDAVVDNPNAERDMKVVSDFVNALTISGDQEKVRSLVNADYIGYGPAAADSSNLEKVLAEWKENYKSQQNRKVNFLTQTFRVTMGNFKGDWVSMWGDYSFTQAGKTITFPYQFTARLADGKIKSTRIYYDVLSILTQLGFKVTPPEMAKK